MVTVRTMPAGIMTFLYLPKFFFFFQKATNVHDIVRHYVLRYTWIGVKDVAANDVYVFIGSGTVLADGSTLWDSGNPNHADGDCVLAYGYDDPATLQSEGCAELHPNYICEKY